MPPENNLSESKQNFGHDQDEHCHFERVARLASIISVERARGFPTIVSSLRF